MKTMNKFKKAFEDRGYKIKSSNDGRVSAQKSLKYEDKFVSLYAYYYKCKEFFKTNDKGEREKVDATPCLKLYASGTMLLDLGIEDIELKTIKYPEIDDIDKLEDYIKCLVILLK